MAHYIGTKSQCEGYNAKAAKLEGLTGDKTNKWSEVIKHPTKDLWAVAKHPDQPSAMQQVEALPADWFLIEEA